MNLKEANNLELIDLIRKGDQSAFRELFDRFYQLLLAVAINLLGDLNQAKDVVQEVFINIWNKRESINIHSAVEPFLKRSVINRSLNRIKARKHTVPEDTLASTPYQDRGHQKLEAQDLENIIQSALNSLPERCRTIFILKRIEGMTLKEIAQQLDISTKTVENQITKALKVLKEAVQPYLENEKEEI